MNVINQIQYRPNRCRALGNMRNKKKKIITLCDWIVASVACVFRRIVAKLFPEAEEPYSSIKANRRNWSRLRDVYKRRKHESTSSLEVFEDDSLEEELERDES